MPKRTVATPNAPTPAAPYVQAVNAGGLLFVSGQLPVDPSSGEIPEGMAAQAALALANVGAILESEGLGFADVVKAMVLLTDMDLFEEMNAVYRSVFGDDLPARTAYQVTRLPRREALIEIEVVALVEGER